MDNTEILSILHKFGERVPQNSRLVLVGGGALALLGSPRLTIDIDFIGDDIHLVPLHKTLMQIAKELRIHVEPVPLDRFLPLPRGSEGRIIRIGQYGNLEIFVADPYSIALSKLDRGLDTDFDDIVFLVQKNYVDMDEFERMVRDALPHARKYDFDPNIIEHLQELRNRLQ
ncbi:MAG TPA: DUF6036 family nucleotidyltransferase [Anaerolineales bacterium]|nr:DUF6036 family nucleotidyltransferase [Anaerolineales bacterium]